MLNDLRESLQQQTATTDVLKVISSSPSELEPVFNAMLENALRICEAKFGMLMLHRRGDGSFHAQVMVDAPTALVDALLPSRLCRRPETLSTECDTQKKRFTSSMRQQKRPSRSPPN